MNRLRTSLLFYSPLSIVFERIAVSEICVLHIAYCIFLAVSHLVLSKKSSVKMNTGTISKDVIRSYVTGGIQVPLHSENLKFAQEQKQLIKISSFATEYYVLRS